MLVAVSGNLFAGKAPQELIQSMEEIPGELLIDVGILVLDPGIDEELDPEILEKQGIFPYLRRSEARCLPYELKDTLEASGFWGAVRIVPQASAAVDLLVTGEIVKSTGLDLVLIIEARDSTGRTWLKPRKYKTKADPRAYQDEDDDDREVVKIDEPYFLMYNQIANDLVEKMLKLDESEVANIRTVTELRFAEDLAPEAFDDYLRQNKKGKTVVDRLPSRDDPMLSRVSRIRETDYEFIDTLNEYYAGFCAEMADPYFQWRGYSYEEQLALQKIRKKARMQKIFGGLLLFAGAMAGAGADSAVAAAAADGAQIAGGLMITSGFLKGKDIKTHKETLMELAGSLDAEVEPMLDEVEGRTLRLSGSAETQYAEFRRLLREIFAQEVGLPLEAEVATDPDAVDPDSTR
jgi:hypothetical protein